MKGYKTISLKKELHDKIKERSNLNGTTMAGLVKSLFEADINEDYKNVFIYFTLPNQVLVSSIINKDKIIGRYMESGLLDFVSIIKITSRGQVPIKRINHENDNTPIITKDEKGMILIGIPLTNIKFIEGFSDEKVIAKFDEILNFNNKFKNIKPFGSEETGKVLKRLNLEGYLSVHGISSQEIFELIEKLKKAPDTLSTFEINTLAREYKVSDSLTKNEKIEKLKKLIK